MGSTPLRLSDVDEITDVMRDAGLVDVQRRITAASQTVDPLAGKNSTPNTV
jgi:hypothetical protein